MLLKGFLYISPSKFTAELKAQLTFVNPEYEKKIKQGIKLGDTSPIFHLYRRVKTKSGGYAYQVPRYTFGDISATARKAYERDVGENKTKIEIAPLIINKGDNFKLNNEQIKTIDATIKMLKYHFGAVIVAKPGEGKTTMAIFIASYLGMKTLVLVHKNTLVKQWKENIMMLTDVKEDEIGLLQQGKFKDGKIVIGMTQSLMRGTISPEINKLFGLVIQDEVHRIGAKEFLKSFTRFNSKYRLGLSATPKRTDEMEKLYYLHTSDNLITGKSVRNITADHMFTEYVRDKKWKYYPPYIPYKIQVIHNIVADEKRNELIVDIVVKAFKKEKRSILILSERIVHLKGLMELTKSQVPKKTKIVRFFGPESITKTQRKQGIKQEKVEDPTLEELNSANIIFATYKKAMEGVDIPHLDTLVYATPLSSESTIEQSVGRIERQFEGKQSPLVLDIYDMNNKLLGAMADKRIQIYEYLQK